MRKIHSTNPEGGQNYKYDNTDDKKSSDREQIQSNRSSEVVKDFGELMDEENKQEEHEERLNKHIQFIRGMISDGGYSTASMTEATKDLTTNEAKIQYLEEK